MRELALPDGVGRIGSFWFYRCHAESVVIPASVVSIGREAFSECAAKKVSFGLGSRLSRLEAYCFRKTGLEGIVLPANVEEVEEGAFYGCPLRKV